jgi:5-methyltetrahydrofolate--homocysteine methyltransferase
MDAMEFAKYGPLLVDAGVNYIGGCCGTSPEHIKMLSKAVSDKKPSAPLSIIPPMLTSSRKGVYVGPSYPFAIIGERINPTGKKKLQEDLREGKTSIVGNFASEQIEADASLLDINVGMPGIDEKQTMVKVVEYVSNQYDIPLCIDSPNPEVIEAALRIYPGRALINSVSLEGVKIKKVLPLAAKYGSMLIALPVGDDGIPDNLDKMKDNLSEILKEGKKLNLPLSSFIADGMVMSSSAKQQHAGYTLDYVEWCTTEFGIGTVLGLSNISFGLPERKWVNGAFLAMAMGRGLSLAIANPSVELIVNLVTAAEVLTGKDQNSGKYIEHFASAEPQKAEPVKVETNNTANLYKAVIRGNRDGILDIFKTCLVEGIDSSVLVNEYIIPAITEVGNKFGDGTFFLPQLLLSAEAVKRVMEFVENSDELSRSLNAVKKGKIVLATVKGDVHDIGKNIVGLLLKNHGYEVIDLGKDVPSEKIVDEALRVNADIVGLSALMTTTMIEMREVVKIAKNKGLTAKIIIGGAVVTQRYADEISADGYSADANEAVLLVGRLMGK